MKNSRTEVFNHLATVLILFPHLFRLFACLDGLVFEKPVMNLVPLDRISSIRSFFYLDLVCALAKMGSKWKWGEKMNGLSLHCSFAPPTHPTVWFYM